MSGVLLYDGERRFFATPARWLARHIHTAAVVQDVQHTDLAPLGLTPADCHEGLLWVDDGRHAAGPEALAAYLETSSDRWRTAGHLLTRPVAKHLTWPVYRWATNHRAEPPRGEPAVEQVRPPAVVKGIRKRKAKDLSACVSLLGVVYRTGQYPVHWPEAPRGWLSDEEVLDAWVFERSGEIHGHIAVSKVGTDTLSALRWREVTGHDRSELAGITRFFVRPRLQHQGIGHALLDVAVSEIRARGLFPVLDVVSRSTDAIALFDELGWRRRAVYPWDEEDEDLKIYFYEPPAGLGAPEDAPPR